MDEKKFKEEIARIQNEIGSYRAELREAKDDLSEAKKLLKTIKQLRDTLDSEMQLVKDSEKKSKRDLDKLTEEWKNTNHHLCEVFKLGYEEIDLSCSDAVESSGKKVSEKYAKGQEILESGLAQQLKNYPEFISKYKGQKPIDIVKKVTKEFEERIKKMTKLQEEYRRINEWILTNGSHIVTLENRNVTRNIMNVASAISLEILLRVHQKSNVKRIVEELADKIEVNVKDVYSKLFPDDASLSFEHLEEGQFLSMINNEPVTHPSGSQRVAISMGIMLSLGETFGLPILLDEAFDRVDANRLKFFAEYITGIASSARMPQICLAGFTTFNIEKNPDVLNFVNSWKLYLLKRATAFEKNIQSLEEIPNS